MATNPVHPPVPPAATPSADARFDELTGVYGFFRRHQKKLLYTAGLFTLLTFSITGPMLSLADQVFGTAPRMPTILVSGKRVALTIEDDQFGDLLARNLGTGLPIGVLPPLGAGEGGQSRAGEALAILRRAAIEDGIEVSMAEVDRAIEVERERVRAPSAAKLARDRSFSSLAQFRTLVAEAMRIGTYVKLQTLALDSSDARVLRQVVKDREKLTLRAATFDEKAVEERLKTDSTLTEEELRKWLDGKNERERMQIQAYDLPRAQLRLVGLLLADGQFDPAQWTETWLKDFTVGDEELKNLYQQEREHRFKLEAAGEYRPLDDEAVKQELTRLAQAEQVMKQLLSQARAKLDEAIRPLTDEVARAQDALSTALQNQKDAVAQLAAKREQLAPKKDQLAQKPDDAALAAEVAALEAEVTRLADAEFAAKDVVPAMQNAVKAAEQAVADGRAAFDLQAVFTELTRDKSGFVQKVTAGLLDADQLKDLDALGLELGAWPNAAVATALAQRPAGELAFSPGRTGKAVVVYQTTAVEPRPLKAWDQLQPLLEGAWRTERAKQEGETARKKLEDALLRLAKEKLGDKVAEIEGKRQARVDERLQAWERETTEAIAKAEQTLQTTTPGTQAHAAWQQELDRQRAALAQKDQRRAAIDKEIAAAIEAEIGAEAKKVHRDVLDQAAAEAGFVVADHGPYVRELSREPRFDKAFDPTVVFLWRNHSKLELGDSTGVVQDATGRRWHVAVCTKVEPMTAADVPRRDFESLRTGDGMASFATQQAGWAYAQAFTVEALEKRYDLQRPVGTQTQQ